MATQCCESQTRCLDGCSVPEATHARMSPALCEPVCTSGPRPLDGNGFPQARCYTHRWHPKTPLIPPASRPRTLLTEVNYTGVFLMIVPVYALAVERLGASFTQHSALTHYGRDLPRRPKHDATNCYGTRQRPRASFARGLSKQCGITRFAKPRAKVDGNSLAELWMSSRRSGSSGLHYADKNPAPKILLTMTPMRQAQR